MKIAEKLQKRIQEGKKNNKGFSLVELIIVIAIMAILIGIVGMNIIPQIENARQSKDLQVLSAYLTESVQALTQNADKCSQTDYTLTITAATSSVVVSPVAEAGATGDTVGAKAIQDSFAVLAGLTSGAAGEGAKAIKFESNAGNDIKSIVIKLSLADSANAAELTLVGNSENSKVGDLVDNNSPLTSK